MKDFVTEKEAANKLCPWIDNWTNAFDPGEGAPVSFEAKPNTCVGSGCMAWRWSHQDNGPTDEPTGFCGQAGLPKYF